jgi:hypothetical protein
MAIFRVRNDTIWCVKIQTDQGVPQIWIQQKKGVLSKSGYPDSVASK